MKVLVCGGRNFGHYSAQQYDQRGRPCAVDEAAKEARMAERRFVHDVLLNHHNKHGPFTQIIEGGANGTDTCAFWFAEMHKIPCRTFKADWNQYGASAGPRRNQQMLDEETPDIVIAFPGGKGTADMINRAEKAGIFVMKVEYRP